MFHWSETRSSEEPGSVPGLASQFTTPTYYTIIASIPVCELAQLWDIAQLPAKIPSFPAGARPYLLEKIQFFPAFA